VLAGLSIKSNHFSSSLYSPLSIWCLHGQIEIFNSIAFSFCLFDVLLPLNDIIDEPDATTNGSAFRDTESHQVQRNPHESDLCNKSNQDRERDQTCVDGTKRVRPWPTIPAGFGVLGLFENDTKRVPSTKIKKPADAAYEELKFLEDQNELDELELIVPVNEAEERCER